MGFVVVIIVGCLKVDFFFYIILVEFIIVKSIKVFVLKCLWEVEDRRVIFILFLVVGIGVFDILVKFCIYLILFVVCDFVN